MYRLARSRQRRISCDPYPRIAARIGAACLKAASNGASRPGITSRIATSRTMHNFPTTPGKAKFPQPIMLSHSTAESPVPEVNRKMIRSAENLTVPHRSLRRAHSSRREECENSPGWSEAQSGEGPPVLILRPVGSRRKSFLLLGTVSFPLTSVPQRLWREESPYGILIRASRRQGDPCLTGHTPEQPSQHPAHPGGQRENNAQVEDPYGRSQALQQDWHRQNQAGPDEDAAHPYFEIAKSEAQAGQNPAGFRRRLQEGGAHDSLRLIVASGSLVETALPGPKSNPFLKRTGPPADQVLDCREIQGFEERVKRFTAFPKRRPPASSRVTDETKMENTHASCKTQYQEE
jgi:hypothetical protein